MNLVPLTPITVVKLCSGVPLDNTYKDTLDFANVSAQRAFFDSKAKYTFTDLTPVRLQNKIRIPKPADEVYDCNYVTFINENFSAKWFYAFITAVDFINVNMCEITIEIDVMQTWWFDITLKPSFVVREHIANDTIGANLVPEHLEIGDYVGHGFDGTNILGGSSIVVASTTDAEGNPVTGGTYCGIYSGLQYNVFTNYQDVNTMIETLTTNHREDAIVSIFQMPSRMVGDKGDAAKTYTIARNKNLSDIDGYKPRNNKLFTYPYNFMYVTNLNGNAAEFPYEYFSTNTCRFTLAGDMSCNPQVFLAPNDYKGISVNYNEKMVLDGYPQCAYSTDAFKAWLAQNGSGAAIGGFGSALALVGGAFTGNAPVAIGGAVGVIGSLTSSIQKTFLPRQAHGSTGSSASFAVGIKDFAFIPTTIRAEYARIIDDFFTMYGYATNRVKVPNVTGRASFNYVKTDKAMIIGNVPFNDLSKIRSIFDNGVTFWHGDWVGDYNRAN